MEESVNHTIAGIPDPMVPSLYCVRNAVKENDDTMTLQLMPVRAAEDRLQNYAPGQFNMLYVFGKGEVPVSISGIYGDGLITHTTRSVGAITRAICTLGTGDMIGLRGPFGTRWPVDQVIGKDLVLVAGGIGLAPLRPVLLEMLNKRKLFQRIILLYGARSPKDIIFREDLKKWKSNPGVELYITVDSGSKTWNGSVGVVTKLISQISLEPANTLAMICGPELMMHFAIQTLLQRGIKSSDIYLSMERNMQCAVGFCGHCQFGPHFICKDGPIFNYDRVSAYFRKPEL